MFVLEYKIKPKPLQIKAIEEAIKTHQFVRNLERQTFELKEFSDEKLVTVAPNTLLIDAIALMSQESASCVLIEQQRALQGIFTERDLVKLTASGAEIGKIAIAEVMTKQPITISTTENLNLVELISLLAKNSIRHLPLVDATGKVLGIITHRSLRKAFKASYLLKHQQVKEVMNRQVICTSSDRSIFQIANLLATHQVSCVLIVETEGEAQLYPKGIVTERDLVNFRALGLDLHQIPAQEVMSTPLFLISPDASLWNAHQLMQQHHIRRLVVTNQDGTLAGIFTQTTILQALAREDLYQCLTELKQVVKEKTEQLEAKIAEQKLLEQQLQTSQSKLRSILAGIPNLDREVTQRTQELAAANASLKRAIRDRVASKTKAFKESEQKYRLAALISSRFINLAAEEIDLGIEMALKEIGEFTNVESSFVFLIDPGQQSFSMTHEWVAKGITSAKEKCQHLSVQMYPWGWEQIRQGKLVYIPSLDSLPPEAAVDRSSFQKAQVKSVVDIPLSISEQVFGWVGFASYIEEKNWSQDWISLLKIVGEIFTNALQRQQSERALKLSQQKFQAIFNQAFQFIGLLNPQGILLEANQTALDAAGLELADVIGQPFWETYWWQISSATQFQLQQAVIRAAKGEFIRYQVDVWGKNKEVITIDFSLKPITDEKGAVVFLISEGRDISDRVKAEAKLKESEAKFRAIFEQAAVGIAHVGLDKKLWRVNQKFADILGYSTHELQKLSFDRITYPGDRASDKKHIQQLIRGEISTLVKEKRYIRQDGSPVWVKLTMAPVCDADDKPEYFISVIEDISQRKAAELALEESEARFFSMVNSFPSLVWISGTDGLYTFFNHAWLDFTGKNIEQELGYGWSEGVHPDDLQYCLDIYQSAFKQHQNFQIEYRLRRFDGQYRWLLDEGIPRFKPDGNFAGYIGTCIDITELKRAKEIKKDAENKALMLKEIHHRIKNNLQIVSALLDLQSEQTQNPEIIDLLEKSQARIYTMGLIHEKLYGSATLDKINFVDYVESLIRYLQTSFIPDHTEIAIILDIEAIDLNIDLAIPCGLIINELVINALQHSFFSQPKGEIEISFYQLSPERFCLTIQDNGVGMRENIDLENLQSLGSLGLSLVKSLATMQLEGTFEIQRVNGTLFKIEFPQTLI